MGGSPDTLAGSDLALASAAALCCALPVCFRSRRPEVLLALASKSRSDSVVLEAMSEAAVDCEDEEDAEDAAWLDEAPEICGAFTAIVFSQLWYQVACQTAALDAVLILTVCLHHRL